MTAVDYTPPPTVANLMQSDAVIRGIHGPLGCISPDTLVVTDRGAIPMCEVTQSVRVLSYDASADRYLYASTSGAFRKGRDYLFRVSTQQGEFDAAGHHQILCADGSYRQVQSLCPGQFVRQYYASRPPTTGGTLGSWRAGARRLRKTVSFTPILSVVRLEYEQEYWDMQVPGTNNYVTVDGAIHHNSGKSAGMCMALVKNAMEQEPDDNGIRKSRFAIIRNTARMLQDTTQKTVFDWFPPGVAGRFMSTKSVFTLEFGDVWTEWLFRPLDSPDDVRNLLSLELTGAWINEYREIHPDILTNLLGRIGRYPPPKTGVRPVKPSIVMDTNPPPRGSYWHSLFENPSPEQKAALEQFQKSSDRPLLAHFKQPGGRSPNAENIENLPDNYYDVLIAANAERGENWVKVHVDGQYGEDPNNLPVYPEFRFSFHTSDEPLLVNPQRPLAIGMDFGRSPAAVTCQQTPHGQWVILDEFLRENCGIEKFLEQWLPWMSQRFPEHKQLDKWQLWPDPSGRFGKETSEKTCFSVLRANGLTPRPTYQDLETRTGSVRRLLQKLVNDGEPALLLDPGCRSLVRGFAGEYAYKKNQEGDLQPHPKKNAASHPQDALQYVIAAYEGPAMRSGARSRNPQHLAGGFNKPVVVKDEWRPW